MEWNFIPGGTAVTQPIAVNDDSFEHEVVEADVPVLVDFWGPWCQPCRQLAPILDGIAEDYAGCLKVAKVDVSLYKANARAYGVTAIPALWLFVDGRAVEYLAGFHSRDQVLELVDARLAAQPERAGEAGLAGKVLRRVFRRSARAA
jgi:thioredoxin